MEVELEVEVELVLESGAGPPLLGAEMVEEMETASMQAADSTPS